MHHALAHADLCQGEDDFLPLVVVFEAVRHEKLLRVCGGVEAGSGGSMQDGLR